MAHAWKACWVQALGGSNPPSSAPVIPVFSRDRDSFEIWWHSSWHSYRSLLVPERPGIPRISTTPMRRLRHDCLMSQPALAVFGHYPASRTQAKHLSRAARSVVCPRGRRLRPRDDSSRTWLRSGLFDASMFAKSPRGERQWSSSRSMPTEVAHASPRQASMPSRTANTAMTRPAIASAHHQPNQVLARRPIRTAADR